MKQVQEISKEEAKSVGLTRWSHVDCDGEPRLDGQAFTATRFDWKEPTDQLDGFACPIDAFRDLWNTTHGPDAWDRNPWCAFYSVTVHPTNIDMEG